MIYANYNALIPVISLISAVLATALNSKGGILF